MLGHHFGLSALREKGARYLREAGDRARMIYANDDAVRFYEQALAALALSDRTPLRLELGERIADLCGPTGRREVAQENYETVLQAYREKGDNVASARILRKMGRLFWDAGKRDNAESRYAEAAMLLEGADAPDRAGASLAGAGPPRVPYRRSRSRCGMGRQGARLRARPDGGACTRCCARRSPCDRRSPEHQGRCAGAARAKPRGGARGRAKHRGGRSRRPAWRRLPRLYQSRRALHDHQSGAGDGRVSAWPGCVAAHR